jgi:hypothetical protein
MQGFAPAFGKKELPVPIQKMNQARIFLALTAFLPLISGCDVPAGSAAFAHPEIEFAGLPSLSSVSSVSLRVSGPDMETDVYDYADIPVNLSIPIPRGPGRVIEMTVNVDLPNSIVTSFKGKAVTDIGSSTVLITLNMGLGSTKLVLPDFKNSRILVLDSISAAGFTAILDASVFPALTANFGPFDVDFDNQGRIYLANSGSAAGDELILRIDDILGSNPLELPLSNSGNAKRALAVDRANGLIYYSSGTDLKRANLDGGDESAALNITSGAEPITAIRGMDIDPDTGALFIAGETTGGAPRIFGYDPSTESFTAFYGGSGGLNSPWDVMVKEEGVYVVNAGGGANALILQFDRNLSLLSGYGIRSSTSSADVSQDIFYDPRRFVAALNQKITIMDERSGVNLDKLVSIDDIAGTNWTTLPNASDSGQSLFSFYYKY